MTQILIQDGLLWKEDASSNDNIVACPLGDRIAQANGMVYVERVVKRFPEGTVLILDKDLKIIKAVKPC